MTVLDPAPLRMTDVVSVSWLDAALAGRDEIREVVGARIVDDYTTVASKVRFTADVIDTDGTRSTRAYCLKGSFSDSSSKRQVDLSLEARFYNELGSSLNVRMPRCIYAGFDPDNSRSIFIMSDLVAEGATFLNSQSPYSPELTAATLGQLANLHAATWGEQRLHGLDWLVGSGPSADTMPAELVDRQVNDGRAEGLPASLRDAERIIAAVRVAMAPQRVCVAHGDPHSLNIYLDRDGRPCLMDWQLLHVGHWATDVAYHVSTVLPTELRRSSEKALLRGYLDELAKLGVEPPSFDEALDRYARQLAYGYFLWCLAAATPRVDIVEHIPRIGAAMIDHDTFARLGV